MARSRRQLESVAVGELDRGTPVGQAKRDRPRQDDEHLVKSVVVGGVAVTRSVRPRRRNQPLVPEARGGVRHPTVTPSRLPTRNVTPAAAAPIATWRAPEY